MSITKPYTFSAGTKARANEVNDDFDVLYSQVNANISRIDSVEFDITELEGNKADVNGNASQRFQVADAINDNDAINKRTLENLTYNVRDYISGLLITKDNNDTIIVSAGSCFSSDYETMMVLASDTSKQNSSQGASTTYYVHLVSNSSGTSSDILISQTKISPPLPGGYTKYRNIGSYATDGGGNIDEIENLTNGDPLFMGDVFYNMSPDFSKTAGYPIATNNTAPSYGYIFVHWNVNGGGAASLTINGRSFMISSSSRSDNSQGASLTFMVAKGDVFNASGGGDPVNRRVLQFIPCKGVQ